MDGTHTTVDISYREASTSKAAVQEISDTLIDAIHYLLFSKSSLKNDITSEMFFSYDVGVESAAAKLFWQRQFSDAEYQTFPVLPSPNHQSNATEKAQLRISDFEWQVEEPLSTSARLRSALALLMACYGDSTDVIFGVMEQQLPAFRNQRQREYAAASRVVATVPVRINFEWDQTVEELLMQAEGQAYEMQPFLRTGLQRIRLISEESQRACEFQTLLVIHTQSSQAKGSDKLGIRPYGIVVEYWPGSYGLEMNIHYDPSLIQYEQAQGMGRQMNHLLRQITCGNHEDVTLSHLELLNEEEKSNIWDLNSGVPFPEDVCVHELVAKQARDLSHAPAICAWDGDLTYTELDDYATRLSRYLVKIGVKKGNIVPLCFEKSMWTSIAMLAIMKAGAACVSMDVGQAKERLRTILSQVKPEFILCSSVNEDLARQLGKALVSVVSRHRLSRIHNLEAIDLPKVSPDDLLYVVFTSGSTGMPKGVMISHSNFTSALKHQENAMHHGPGERVYDISSYISTSPGPIALTPFASEGVYACHQKNHARTTSQRQW